jgi:RND family efflux transporter MFP subunit
MRLTARLTCARPVAFLAGAMLALPIGCGKNQSSPAPPPPAVTVAHPVEHEVIEWNQYTGYLQAPDFVNVMARVSGLLESASFKEGSIVKQGQVLFTIDKRPFQADLDAKVATVEKDKAQVALAQANFQRTAQALKGNAVSQQDYDTTKAQLEQAQAQLDADKAAEEQSRLNLQWCQVTAPVTGRVSNYQVTAGNLVNGNSAQPTLLTTITSVDPIYCYFNVDEQSVLKYQALIRQNKVASARISTVPAFMALADETNFPHEGYIDFVNNQIYPNTGTMQLRAVFPNPTGWLTPGMYARVRVPGSGRYQAVLVPDAAVGADQNLRFLLSVGPDDLVQRHQVELGALFGELRAITSGISPADQVIINGQLRARPGMKVKPVAGTFSLKSLQLTIPGSPTTQSLPATGPTTRLTTEPTTQPATASMTRPARGRPATAPATGATP